MLSANFGAEQYYSYMHVYGYMQLSCCNDSMQKKNTYTVSTKNIYILVITHASTHVLLQNKYVHYN